AMVIVGSRAAIAAPAPSIDVYKSPACGCCGQWVRHMRGNGFSVVVHDVGDLDAVRARAGVPRALASCHTAWVGGYVLEGHVPALDVRKLLAERPKAVGLTVPGMPASAPGMDLPGAIPYDVLLFQADGATRAWHSYR
ncbi:MAG TPA: DUF411 domain-containing protein, partial [Candidatus Tumulicola sp.]|nr:DUF411 domain-containing protein [Candidatus Tumulicola sp.]